MRKIPRWVLNAFSPKELQSLNVQELLDALNDVGVRKIWIYDLLVELKRMNLEVDARLLKGETRDLTDLAARRKAYQDVLEGILSAKRQARDHNPKSRGEFDLESVTVGPAYI